MTDERTHALEVSTQIEASPETVFGLLGTAEGLGRWLDAEIISDMTPGSEIRILFQNGTYVHCGEIVALDPPRRLAFTWDDENKPERNLKGSLVDIRLEAAGEGCRVVLRHSHLPSDDERQKHESGWRGFLERMRMLIGQGAFLEQAEAAVVEFLNAWSTDNSEERAEALKRSCADTVRYADLYACTEGCQSLAAHIAAARSIMSGVQVEKTSKLQLVQDAGRHSIRLAGPDGTGFGVGENVYGFTEGGKIRSVIGFSGTLPGNERG